MTDLFDLVVIAGCITCWCPCITFGQIAENVEKGETSKHQIRDETYNWYWNGKLKKKITCVSSQSGLPLN